MRAFALHAGRLAWPASLAVVCGVPLAALAVAGVVSPVFLVVLAGLAGVTLARPAIGVVLLAPLFALTVAIETLGLPAFLQTDAIVMAFVCGAAWRLAWPHDGQRTRLGAPALILGAAVAASTIVEIRMLYVIAPQRPVWREIWTHVMGGAYWRDPRPFVFLHDAIEWIAWLAAAVFAERALRRWPDEAAVAVRVWLVSAAAAASYAVGHVITRVLQQPGSWLSTLRWIAAHERLTSFTPDANAAGSYFAVPLVAAFVRARQRRDRGLLILTAPLVAAAFALAQSRAAIAAAGLVIAIQALRGVVGLRRRPLWIAGAVVSLVVVAGALAATARSHAPLSSALELRRELTVVAWRTADRYRWFGVGLGEYIKVSRRFISPDQTALIDFAPNGENAHDNFLQIFAELGAPACLAFLWLVWPVPLSAWTRTADEAGRDAIAIGLCAFLLSAMFGHPLLVVQVAAAFFVALGIAASAAPSPASSPWRRRVTIAGVAFFALSILGRVR